MAHPPFLIAAWQQHHEKLLCPPSRFAPRLLCAAMVALAGVALFPVALAQAQGVEIGGGGKGGEAQLLSGAGGVEGASGADSGDAVGGAAGEGGAGGRVASGGAPLTTGGAGGGGSTAVTGGLQ